LFWSNDVQTPPLNGALGFRSRAITRPASHPSEKPKKNSNPNLTSTHLPITLTHKPPIVPPESSVKTDPSSGFEQGGCVLEDTGGGRGEGGAVQEVVLRVEKWRKFGLAGWEVVFIGCRVSGRGEVLSGFDEVEM
jgi:hypothetical protein